MNRIAFLSMNRLTEIFNIFHHINYITDVPHKFHGDDNLHQQYHNSYKNENVEKEMNLFNNSSRNRIYF